MTYRIMHKAGQGFTLIETLVALAIFSVLIGALMVVNRDGLNALSEAEDKALARRALANVITTFRQEMLSGKVSQQAGRHQGSYQMAYADYQWEIVVVPSQHQLTYLLQATIRRKAQQTILARIQEIR